MTGQKIYCCVKCSSGKQTHQCRDFKTTFWKKISFYNKMSKFSFTVQKLPNCILKCRPPQKKKKKKNDGPPEKSFQTLHYCILFLWKKRWTKLHSLVRGSHVWLPHWFLSGHKLMSGSGSVDNSRGWTEYWSHTRELAWFLPGTNLDSCVRLAQGSVRDGTFPLLKRSVVQQQQTSLKKANIFRPHFVRDKISKML